MMSRIDAHAMAKNTFRENFSVQKYLTIIKTGGSDLCTRAACVLAGRFSLLLFFFIVLISKKCFFEGGIREKTALQVVFSDLQI